MSALTLETIVSGLDATREAVSVAELGGEVWIRSMQSVVKDRWDHWLSSMTDEERVENFRGKLVAACLCDENGKPLCEETREAWAVVAGDIGNGLSANVMARLFSVASRLNGIGVASDEAAEKN